MTDAERNAVDNLLVLCPNHHREVDRLRPQDWPPERLMELKADHEAACGRREWASDAELEFYASLLINANEASTHPPQPTDPPRLSIEPSTNAKDGFDVVNIGRVDASTVTVELAPHDGRIGGVLDIERDQPVRRLSPGARWRAGYYVRTAGGGGRPVVIIRWHDSDGNSYDGEYPL